MELSLKLSLEARVLRQARETRKSVVQLECDQTSRSPSDSLTGLLGAFVLHGSGPDDCLRQRRPLYSRPLYKTPGDGEDIRLWSERPGKTRILGLLVIATSLVCLLGGNGLRGHTGYRAGQEARRGLRPTRGGLSRLHFRRMNTARYILSVLVIRVSE